MNDDRDALDALTTALALKDETRTGWALRGVRDPESVAAHTWGVSLLCLLYASEEVDRDRALRMAVVHDLAEAETGDVAVRAEAGKQAVSDAEKTTRERAALADLADGLPRDEEVRDLWTAYEARDTPEAAFVKDMDLVDRCLQALVYEREGRYDPEAPDASEHFEEYDQLDEFFATAEPRLRTAVGRELFDAARERYEEAKQQRQDDRQ